MLDGVYSTARCASSRTGDRPLLDSDMDRPTNGEHVLERRGDKFNFAELASGTCKLARNELCYIVLDVHLEFRRENRVATVGRNGIIEDRDMQIR